MAVIPSLVNEKLVLFIPIILYIIESTNGDNKNPKSNPNIKEIKDIIILITAVEKAKLFKESPLIIWTAIFFFSFFHK